MKILYLKLVNSAGIYAGTSKRKIEIDFTKGTNNIVMLFGGNGSAKTTILSSLHPFNSTCNDERDKFFIEGKEGEKEIHYLLDDVVYMIRHYVSSKNKTKSYIARMDYSDYISKHDSKDELADKYGEELNENGGVITFKEIVETYLGVDEEFFKISRIGSNVTNFIDLSTANRKKYISTFLPNIDEYLQRYKIVNEKYKVMTKEIKYLSDEILKLDDENTLNLEKTRLEKQLESLRNSIERCSNKIATAKATVTTLDKDGILKASKYENPYSKELVSLEKEKVKIENVTSNYSVDEIKGLLEETEKKINETKNLIFQIKEKIGNEKENLGTTLVNIKTKTKQIEGMNIADLTKLENMLDDNNTKIETYESELSDIKLSNFTNLEILKGDISGLTYFMRTTYNSLSTEQSKISIEYKKILDKLFISKVMSWKNFSSEIESLKQTKNNREKEKQELTNKLSTANSNRKYLSILEQRPEDCLTDNCPFIATALQYKDIDKEIDRLERELIIVNDIIDILNEDIEIFENVESIGNRIEILYANGIENFTNLNKIVKDFNVNSFDDLMIYFLNTTTIEKKKVLFEGSGNLKYYNSLNKEISDLRKENETIREKIRANESIDSIYKELSKELSDLETKKEEVSKNIANYNLELVAYESDKDSLESKMVEYTTIMEYFNEEKSFLEKYNDVKEKYENTEKILLEISDLANVVAENKEEKESYSQQLPLIENALDKVKIKINKLKEYTDRKKILDDNYEKTSWIKDALNPTKGIPVYFIDNYLDKTKFITNNLLDISQNGRFAISFEVTDKDFFIKVYKNNGDILSDISQASQGETALTSLSLSLALIEQSMKKYNIFLLDELDGALDATNRRCFIDMVQSQMKVLNSEQVFIISHNNEFENIPIDMILLRDNNIDTNNKDFMTNKTVLFSV